MNEVINQLKSRKSIRVFEDRFIETDEKNEILQAALEAPTAGAMMLYSIIDITSPELKEKLAVLCDNQPFIAKAPMVLIFLADYQRCYDTFVYTDCNPRTPETGDLLLAYSDALIAAQNTVVAAESLNIGSCYIGDIIENCEKVQDLLKLPEYVMPAAMLVYGYPTQQQKQRTKPARFNKEYIVFENSYQKLSPEEHKRMYEQREQKAGHNNSNDYSNGNGNDNGHVTSHSKYKYPDNIQAFCKRKYMSDFCKEMSRSANEYLKNFK